MLFPCSFTQWTPNNHDQLLIIIPLRSLVADIENALSGALADCELLVLCSAKGSDEKDPLGVAAVTATKTQLLAARILLATPEVVVVTSARHRRRTTTSMPISPVTTLSYDVSFPRKRIYCHTGASGAQRASPWSTGCASNECQFSSTRARVAH